MALISVSVTCANPRPWLSCAVANTRTVPVGREDTTPLSVLSWQRRTTTSQLRAATVHYTLHSLLNTDREVTLCQHTPHFSKSSKQMEFVYFWNYFASVREQLVIGFVLLQAANTGKKISEVFSMKLESDMERDHLIMCIFGNFIFFAARQQHFRSLNEMWMCSQLEQRGRAQAV